MVITFGGASYESTAAIFSYDAVTACRIRKLAADGSLIGTCSLPGIPGPIAVDHQGNAWCYELYNLASKSVATNLTLTKIAP